MKVVNIHPLLVSTCMPDFKRLRNASHINFMHAHIPNPKFMVMAETSTSDIFLGRNSMAEMSEPKRPWPKCPWPKCPSTTSTTLDLP